METFGAARKLSQNDARNLYPFPKLCYNRNIERKTSLPEDSGLNLADRTSMNVPAPAYERQDVVFARPLELLSRAVADRGEGEACDHFAGIERTARDFLHHAQRAGVFPGDG